MRLLLGQFQGEFVKKWPTLGDLSITTIHQPNTSEIIMGKTVELRYYIPFKSEDSWNLQLSELTYRNNPHRQDSVHLALTYACEMTFNLPKYSHSS